MDRVKKSQHASDFALATDLQVEGRKEVVEVELMHATSDRLFHLVKCTCDSLMFELYGLRKFYKILLSGVMTPGI